MKPELLARALWYNRKDKGLISKGDHFVAKRKCMKTNLKLMCFHIITAIFVIIFALSLHLIENVGYEEDAYWFGILVSCSFMYDLVLYLLIFFQLVVIVLIVILHWNFGVKR